MSESRRGRILRTVTTGLVLGAGSAGLAGCDDPSAYRSGHWTEDVVCPAGDQLKILKIGKLTAVSPLITYGCHAVTNVNVQPVDARAENGVDLPHSAKLPGSGTINIDFSYTPHEDPRQNPYLEGITSPGAFPELVLEGITKLNSVSVTQ